MGGGSPEGFVSILRMHKTALSKYGKSLVLARIRGTLAFAAVAKQMRRLFGSCGSVARQDVVVAADAGLSSRDEIDHAPWEA